VRSACGPSRRDGWSSELTRTGVKLTRSHRRDSVDPDPERHFTTANYRIAKGFIRRSRRQRRAPLRRALAPQNLRVHGPSNCTHAVAHISSHPNHADGKPIRNLSVRETFCVVIRFAALTLDNAVNGRRARADYQSNAYLRTSHPWLRTHNSG
jgi:hypothetical protein